MQTRVRVFGRAKTNYVIAKNVYTRFSFSIIRDRSFLVSSFDSGMYVACLVRMRDDVL